jgi:hypothetical protein
MAAIGQLVGKAASDLSRHQRSTFYHLFGTTHV